MTRAARLLALFCLPLVVAACGARPEIATEAPPAPVPPAPAAPAPGQAFLDAAMADPYAYRTLGELCDTVGSRFTGSPDMARAVEWAVRTLGEAGFDSVWTEPVTVPHWTRGAEWARCTAPVAFDMEMIGLGLSDGTGPDGIEAEVLVVRDFDELEARSAEAAGRIVLFNPDWEGYGKTVQYRVRGASAAARHGAVACLIRSVTDNSLATPHTGMMRYEDDAPRIPAAALTVEAAGRLQRLADRGITPRVHLYMEAENHGLTTCHNVIGDIRGERWPEQIVLLGGHLDSWDVGTCAHDDAAGCVMTLAAARRLIQDGRRPGRTVRLVLYTAEEIGGDGGRAYRDAHAHELDRHVAALESDSGAFEPRGFTVQGDSLVVARLQEYAAPLAGLGADPVRPGWSGVDIRPICDEGVPGIGHRVKGDEYFHYHHSHADTFDKIDAGDLAKNVAAIAWLIGAVADDPVALRDLVELHPMSR